MNSNGHTTTDARIETRDGVTLVFGVIGMRQMADLCKKGSAIDVVSPDLAYLCGANLAYGLPEAVDALLARVRSEKAAAAHPVKLSALVSAAQDLAIAREVGASSAAAAIFTWMTGIKLDIHTGLGGAAMPTAFPLDPADLRHCRLLLEAVPSFATRFGAVMAEVSPAWAALVNAWPNLCSTMDQECPTWRKPSGRDACRETYALMREVIDRRMSTTGGTPR